jgi:hypothetical protein
VVRQGPAHIRPARQDVKHAGGHAVLLVFVLVYMHGGECLRTIQVFYWYVCVFVCFMYMHGGT